MAEKINNPYDHPVKVLRDGLNVAKVHVNAQMGVIRYGHCEYKKESSALPGEYTGFPDDEASEAPEYGRPEDY